VNETHSNAFPILQTPLQHAHDHITLPPPHPEHLRPRKHLKRALSQSFVLPPRHPQRLLLQRTPLPALPREVVDERRYRLHCRCADGRSGLVAERLKEETLDSEDGVLG
jgi:hypothetical protein